MDDDKNVGVTYSAEFSSPEELQSTWDNVLKAMNSNQEEETGVEDVVSNPTWTLEKKNGGWRINVDIPAPSEDTSTAPEAAMLLSSMTYEMIVEMPGEIVDTNGDISGEDNNISTYNLNLQSTEAQNFYAESKGGGLPWILIIGAVGGLLFLLLAGGVVVFLVMRRRKNKNNETPAQEMIPAPSPMETTNMGQSQDLSNLFNDPPVQPVPMAVIQGSNTPLDGVQVLKRDNGEILLSNGQPITVDQLRELNNRGWLKKI